MTKSTQGLTGTTVVLIGGGTGIGFETARQVIAAGGEVVLGGRNIERLNAAVQLLGDKAVASVVDTADCESLRHFFDGINRVDHLFVTAASYTVGSMRTLSTAEAASSFDSKFWGQYNAVKSALPKFAADGSVVLMAGAASVRPPAAAPAYVACNAAIEGLGRGLAFELAPIRVNVVSPGTIDGHLWANRPAEVRRAAFDQYARDTLLHRVGTENEVAQAVLMLFQNTYMTGSTIYPDGGYALR